MSCEDCDVERGVSLGRPASGEEILIAVIGGAIAGFILGALGIIRWE